MMVMQYFPYGSIKNIYNRLSLKGKMELFTQIAKRLKAIHSKGFIHKDLHSGNILRFVGPTCFITDLGLCKPVNEQGDHEKKIFGVLPYVAPEVRNFSQCFIYILVLHVYIKYTGWVMPSIIPNHFFYILIFGTHCHCQSREGAVPMTACPTIQRWPSQGAICNMDYPTTRLTK
jgi:serine/threonine protein kinase